MLYVIELIDMFPLKGNSNFLCKVKVWFCFWTVYI